MYMCVCVCVYMCVCVCVCVCVWINEGKKFCLRAVSILFERIFLTKHGTEWVQRPQQSPDRAQSDFFFLFHLFQEFDLDNWRTLKKIHNIKRQFGPGIFKRFGAGALFYFRVYLMDLRINKNEITFFPPYK